REEQRRQQRQRDEQRPEGRAVFGKRDDEQHRPQGEEQEGEDTKLHEIDAPPRRRLRQQPGHCPVTVLVAERQPAQGGARQDIDAGAGAANRQRKVQRRGEQPTGTDGPDRQQRAEFLLDHAVTAPGSRVATKISSSESASVVSASGDRARRRARTSAELPSTTTSYSRPRRRRSRAPGRSIGSGSVAKRA